jgi:alpha-amylase
MKAVCLCFQVHQPLRNKWYWPSEGYSSETASLELYFDQGLSYSLFENMSRVYLEANEVLLRSGLVCTFNISGSFFDLCRWKPEIIASFRELKKIGVEFAASPYYNSLCSLYSTEEFKRQVTMHRETLREKLGVKSTSFINTELVHNSDIAVVLSQLGFSAVVSEGRGGLGERCCVFDDGVVPFLLRHHRLSEDVEFRFPDANWSEYPLTASKFVGWIASMQGDVVTLYLDYASFGKHGEDSLKFLEELSTEFARAGIEAVSVSDAVSRFDASFYDGAVDFSRNNLKHCLANHMQHVYFNELKRLSAMAPGDDVFGYLQQADILMSMSEHMSHPFDSAVNAFSILSDYMRRQV